MNLRVVCTACQSRNVKAVSKEAIRLKRFVDYKITFRCGDCQHEFVVGR